MRIPPGVPESLAATVPLFILQWNLMFRIFSARAANKDCRCARCKKFSSQDMLRIVLFRGPDRDVTALMCPQCASESIRIHRIVHWTTIVTMIIGILSMIAAFTSVALKHNPHIAMRIACPAGVSALWSFLIARTTYATITTPPEPVKNEDRIGRP